MNVSQIFFKTSTKGAQKSRKIHILELKNATTSGALSGSLVLANMEQCIYKQIQNNASHLWFLFKETFINELVKWAQSFSMQKGEYVVMYLYKCLCLNIW